MDDDSVGYGKPPRHTRFRKGVCPNPQGRGSRKDKPRVSGIDAFLGEQVPFQEGGRRKMATPNELSVRRLTRSALVGDVRSAQQLITLRRRAITIDDGPLIIRVSGGLPERK